MIKDKNRINQTKLLNLSNLQNNNKIHLIIDEIKGYLIEIINNKSTPNIEKYDFEIWLEPKSNLIKLVKISKIIDLN